MSSDCDGVGRGRKKKGGRCCVAGDPNQQSCRKTSYTPGITMHELPKDENLRQEWSDLLYGIGPTTKLKADMQLSAPFILMNQVLRGR